jgi:hypothetical protein
MRLRIDLLFFVLADTNDIVRHFSISDFFCLLFFQFLLSATEYRHLVFEALAIPVSQKVLGISCTD